MKKSVFVASFMLAGFAFASTTEVTNDYVLGVMPLTISGSEVIINIPWVEPGGSGDSIAVSNIVKTSNLDNGDMLYWYNPAGDHPGYRAWRLTEGSVKYWNAVTIASSDYITTVSPDTPSLKRGQALILKRASSSSEATIYIVGQYTDAVTTAVTISKGYNLLAPPIVSNSVNLVSYNWSGAANGDKIILEYGTTYSYNGSNWGRWTYTKATGIWSFAAAETISITAGKGFWYVRVVDGTFDFNWATGD